MKRDALISDCQTYRYRLTRAGLRVNDLRVAFIGLNPSTADATVDDPTIRRCIGFARDWGFGELVMLNLFAYRATDPKVMRAARDPAGPENDRILVEEAAAADLVVAAWGAHGAFLGRDMVVRKLLEPVCTLHALSLTVSGSPGHPLYLPATRKPFVWSDDGL